MSIFVANSGEDTISVICPDTLQETDRIKLTGTDGKVLGPKRLLADQGHILYINTFDGSVGALNLLTGELIYAAVGACPTDCCFIKNGLLICCGESDNVWKLSRDGLSAQSCSTFGIFPYSIDARAELALVAHITSCDISLFTPEDMQERSKILLPGVPMCAAFAPDGRIFTSYLSSGEYGAGKLSSFTQDGKIISSVTLTGIAGKLCFADNKVFAAGIWDIGITVVDSNAMKIENIIETESMPDDMLIDPLRGRVFVSCMMDDAVDVLTLSGKHIRRIPVGREPRGLATL